MSLHIFTNVIHRVKSHVFLIRYNLVD